MSSGGRLEGLRFLIVAALSSCVLVTLLHLHSRLDVFASREWQSRAFESRKDAAEISTESDWRLQLRSDAAGMIADHRSVHRAGEAKSMGSGHPSPSALEHEDVAMAMIPGPGLNHRTDEALENAFPVNTRQFSVNTSQFNVPPRRHRVAWCGAHHSSSVVHMLKSEFGFKDTVDPLRNDEWDLIYGGYPHCGEGNGADPPDWNMRERLNKHLNERGWDNLKPFQVWFPCMGCRTTYCNKRELCRLVRQISTSEGGEGEPACYLLPENRIELEHRMRSDPNRLWVVKRDSSKLHLHAGTGVSYAHSIKDLPAKALTEESLEYLAMPYVRPYLGNPKNPDYRRKSELRVYLAVTAVFPKLRLYAYSQAWIVLAGSKYKVNASSIDECIHDTHAHSGNCGGKMSNDQRQLTFEGYVKKVDMPPTIRDRLLPEAHALLSRIIHQATPQWQAHHVNEGIAKSGASCFSYMRADLGISESGRPFVFEINELPYVNEEASQIRPLQQASLRDLFSMIGLAREPILFRETAREDFEMHHLGGWVRLEDKSS